MKVYVSNAFALSMLDREQQWADPKYGAVIGGEFLFPRTPRSVDDPEYWLEGVARAGGEVISIVGHADTAALFSRLLGREILPNRATITLGPTDILLVGQYIGPRLPEGATALPEGARIEWWVI